MGYQVLSSAGTGSASMAGILDDAGSAVWNAIGPKLDAFTTNTLKPTMVAALSDGLNSGLDKALPKLKTALAQPISGSMPFLAIAGIWALGMFAGVWLTVRNTGRCK